MTPCSEAKGMFCSVCAGPATHQYGPVWICCDCHAGGEPGGGLFTREEAERIHRGEDPFPRPDVDTTGLHFGGPDDGMF